jgi:gas vesicle structural protein
MAVERASAGSSLIDVLDRVLDKGIVIDAYVRVSLVGIDLVSVEARIVVASVETYLRFAEAIAITGQASRPSLPATGISTLQSDLDLMRAENAELRRRLDELS